MPHDEKTRRASGTILTSTGDTADVRAMYEEFPYPSPVAGGELLLDLANLLTVLWDGADLSGKRLLDAGCGTGQRLLGAAQRFPEAHFVGLDMTSASLEAAGRLAREHGIDNVEFQRADLLRLELDERFDIVTSTGVLHHLEDPARGLAGLVELLTDDGVLGAWLYHALGEHSRLCDRELFQTLWGGNERAAGLELLERLQLTLDPNRYGTGSDQLDAAQINIDVDAYMHPIVHAYRFEDAIDLFDTGQVDWVAINGINGVDWSKSLDLEGVDRSKYRFVNLTAADLFEDESLQRRFLALDKRSKLRVIELVKRPTGFTMLGGRGSASDLSARVAGNVLEAALRS
jgi:trans-aconitate methyltransferase